MDGTDAIWLYGTIGNYVTVARKFNGILSTIHSVMIIIIIKMLIVQYPMQFNGPPRNISTILLYARANGGSTNTTGVHIITL